MIGGFVSNYVWPFHMLFPPSADRKYKQSIRTSQIALSLHVVSDLMDLIVWVKQDKQGWAARKNT